MKPVMLFLLAGAILFAASDEVEKGRALYRSNCAFCHGLTGLGGRGPNLVAGEPKAAEDIKRIVSNGVPGSTMPAFGSLDPDELDAVAGFVKHLSSSGVPAETASGDPIKGQAVYGKLGCPGCHQIGEQGSVYGPDLSRIGGARSLHYLEESIVKPSADIADGYSGVTVVTREGRKLTGVRVNEDTFSVQLRLPNQQFRSFRKDEVQQVAPAKESLMPAYANVSKDDLNNLLTYLKTLRGNVQAGADTKKAKGIQ